MRATSRSGPAPTRLGGLVTALAMALVLAACGSDRTGGPTGAPTDVVRGAPERTLAAAAVSVEASAPDAQSAARLAPGAPHADLEARGPGAAAGYPELADPLGLVDLVRGAVDVVSYGGQPIRGVSTFRYEVVVNVERALAVAPPARQPATRAMAERVGSSSFYADVWVDNDGRLRRIQVPVAKTAVRPEAHVKVPPAVVTVDLFDYAAGGS